MRSYFQAFPTLRLAFHQAPQPWHPQGTAMHEAVLALRQIGLGAGADEAYLAAMTWAFKIQPEFVDVATYELSRKDLYAKLAASAVAEGLLADAAPLLALLEIKVGPNGERNSGNATFKDFTLVCKYHRQRSVHVTPTCAVNGIICDTSSGWTVLEWKHFLSGVLPAAHEHAQ